MSKSIFWSKTFWVNAIVMVVGLADQFMPFIPTEYKDELVTAVATLNVILRYFTKQPVTVK